LCRKIAEVYRSHLDSRWLCCSVVHLEVRVTAGLAGEDFLCYDVLPQH
jgi:hypothetical protein